MDGLIVSNAEGVLGDAVVLVVVLVRLPWYSL